MAKENREAEHMLGHNDPKQNKHQKKKKRETQMKRAWVQQKHNDERISQQAAQAMLSSSLPYVLPWTALLLFANYVYTKRY